MTVRPSAAFAASHPAHVIALGFGAGLSPYAPGTAGTLLAWALGGPLEKTGSELKPPTSEIMHWRHLDIMGETFGENGTRQAHFPRQLFHQKNILFARARQSSV